MGFVDYVDHGMEACGAAKITYADVNMSESDPSLGSCTDNMKRLMYQRLKGFHFSETSSVPAPYSFEPSGQTVPQRILVMTLTTVDFQVCHRKMSKKSGSS